VDVSKAGLRDLAVARLSGLTGLRSRGMFGAYGLWAEDGLFFGIVDERHVYFRVSDETRPRYVALGSSGFDWSGGREPPSESYYAVPPSVWDDPPTLLAWAEDALDAARAAKRSRSPSRAAARAPRSRGTRS
jgi:TfoX/Sxy family transcriptional regulator of competence genes